MCEHEAESDEHSLFVGHVPPLWLLDYELQSLFSVVELPKVEAATQPNRYRDVVLRATDVALVGALGFFEAFCKHQFAALVNIHPPLIEGFSSRRPDSTIPLAVLAGTVGNIDASFGFLLAEQYDFGSPKLVNGLFRDLIEVTPFGTEERERLDALIRQRNLVVHHAGFPMRAFVSAAARRLGVASPASREAVTLEAEAYYEVDDFLRRLAVKAMSATVDGLQRRTNGLADVLLERRGSVRCLRQVVWDEID